MDKHYCPYCMAPVAEGESCSVCGLTAGIYVPSPHHLPPGTVLTDRYLVGRVLGEGGFGITYIGRDLRLELKVAIKEYYPMDRATRNAGASLEVTSLIGPSAASFERGKQKFLSEAQVMAKMDKQQVIVSVRDFFEANNTAYIVMEYIEGITLRELVEQRGGKIPPEELFSMIEPLFLALSIMHENGLIHRDISPDNLMLENGKIRLLDFGCAREASRGTETMTIALKHGYAPIEQYQQKGQGPWTDIYALCATIYYCLTGKVPPQALDRITEDELLLPGKLGVDITDEQEKALLKGMRLQPNRRFASARELWAALYTRKAGEETPGTLPAGFGRRDAGKRMSGTEAVSGNAVAGKAAEGSIGGHDADREERLGEADFGSIAGKEAEARAGGIAGERRSEEGIFGNSDNRTEMRREIVPGESVREPVAGEETTENGGTGVGRRLWRKYAVPAGAGIGACILLILIVTVFWPSARQAGNLDGTDGQKDSISKSEEISSGGEPSSGEESGPEEGESQGESISTEVPTPVYDFTDAAVVTEGDSEELRRLLEDASIPAVVLDCGRLRSMAMFSVTKPVLVAEGTVWEAVGLTVEDGGTIQVEGTLDMTAPGYLRLKAGGVRLSVEDMGSLALDGLLWMDEEECFAGVEEKETGGHVLVFSEEIFEGPGVVSVTDYTALAEAAVRGRTISIDGDITLTGHLTFSAPVRISEGVTVDGILFDNGIDQSRYLAEGFPGCVLVNNGTLDNIYMEEDTILINNGLLTGEVPEGIEDASLWFEPGSTLVNLGTVDGDDCSRLLEDTLFVNLGTVNAHNMALVGGKMMNFGTLALPEKDGFFEMCTDSLLLNAEDALVTVAPGASFWNRSRIYNVGEMRIERDAQYANVLLENDGLFRVEKGAITDPGYSYAGLWYGAGVYEAEGADIRVYDVGFGNFPYMEEGAAAVQNAQELKEALENPDTEQVFVKADIVMEENFTVRKDLYIEGGCSLTITDGAELVDYGGQISLGKGASLQGMTISLYEDARLFLGKEASLTVTAGGCLELDESLLWGHGGNIRINGAELLLKNKSGFLFDQLDSLEAREGRIELRSGSVYVTPYGTGQNLTGADIVLSQGEDTWFHVLGDGEFTDCSAEINAGRFCNESESLTWNNCRVTVGKEGILENGSAHGRLALLGGTTLEVWGRAELSGWDDQARFTVHGKVTNYGEMVFTMPVDLSEPIVNEGNLYYDQKRNERYRLEQGRYKLDLSQVTGNTPIPVE